MGHPLTVQPQVIATGTTGPTLETKRGHLPGAVQLELQAGEAICMLTPGGGGMGR